VTKCALSYRRSLSQTRRDALLEIIAQALGAVGQRVTPQAETLGQSLAPINLHTFFVAVILQDQFGSVARQSAQTIFQAVKA
jgi:hypothetical protein